MTEKNSVAWVMSSNALKEWILKDPLDKWKEGGWRLESCLYIPFTERILKGFVCSMSEKVAEEWVISPTVIDSPNSKEILSSVNVREPNGRMYLAYTCHWPIESWQNSFSQLRINGGGMTRASYCHWPNEYLTVFAMTEKRTEVWDMATTIIDQTKSTRILSINVWEWNWVMPPVDFYEKKPYGTCSLSDTKGNESIRHASSYDWQNESLGSIHFNDEKEMESWVRPLTAIDQK